MSSDLEKRVKSIEDRNARVEADKKWETSLIRRTAITLLTYVTIVAFLFMIDNEQPFVTAIVPALGYYLSTLAMTSLKKRWLKGRA